VIRCPPADLAGREFDLVVIGGGITGVAVARDAALRGMTVVLLEQDDFAAGTSSRSTKLVHGGLRYLESHQFALVAESLRERERTLRLAPHLTHVRPFLYLLYRGYPESRSRLRAGLTFYDAASGAWTRRRHRMLTAAQVLAREPNLAADGLLGAGLFHDALTDDARLTVETAQAAAAAGALLANHAAVTGLVLDRGRVRGVRVTDGFTGTVTDVFARQLVNATGAWSDRIRALQPTPGAARVRPTKGVHIVLRRSDFPLGTAVFLRSPDDNRVVWPIPSLDGDLVYIGTTDTDYTGDPDDVRPDAADVRYLLNVANRTIPDAAVDERHVVGSWAGLRPLIRPAPGLSESGTSREHALTPEPTGMLTISGGKLTSHRVMARAVVDAVQAGLGRGPVRSTAARRPLPGADPHAIGGVRIHARGRGVPPDLVESWIRRYGAGARRILDRWSADESSRRAIGARGLTAAELAYLVHEEMASTLPDVLVRRTSAFFWDQAGTLETIDAVADEMAALLGWSVEQRAAEVDGYRELVRRHRPAVAG
jgi:glycerol-3-phosphate dehydrogenase